MTTKADILAKARTKKGGASNPARVAAEIIDAINEDKDLRDIILEDVTDPAVRRALASQGITHDSWDVADLAPPKTDATGAKATTPTGDIPDDFDLKWIVDPSNGTVHVYDVESEMEAHPQWLVVKNNRHRYYGVDAHGNVHKPGGGSIPLSDFQNKRKRAAFLADPNAAKKGWLSKLKP